MGSEAVTTDLPTADKRPYRESFRELSPRLAIAGALVECQPEWRNEKECEKRSALLSCVLRAFSGAYNGLLVDSADTYT